jgi:hypothetical protein
MDPRLKAEGDDLRGESSDAAMMALDDPFLVLAAIVPCGSL